MTEGLEAPPTVLFHEPGASWWWLSLGVIAGGSMAFIQNTTGNGLDASGHLELARKAHDALVETVEPG